MSPGGKEPSGRIAEIAQGSDPAQLTALATSGPWRSYIALSLPTFDDSWRVARPALPMLVTRFARSVIRDLVIFA